MLVDSHCHLDQLDLSAYDNCLDKVLEAAKKHDVAYMLNVCIDIENFPAVKQIAQRYDHIWASVGVHPNVTEGADPSLDDLIAFADDPNIVAIGETGLDYFRSSGELQWQRERFRRHIKAAIATHKPVIIHSRDAGDDTIKILQEENVQQVGGILHCFTGTKEMAEAAIELGLYISFSGIVTFKSAAALQHVAKTIPLDKIFIETDAPYLAPVPYRGKPNYPQYVQHVAQAIAQLRGVSYQTIANATTENFFRLFSTIDPRQL